MLETMGQFGLQYSDQAQGTLGSLVATPFLLNSGTGYKDIIHQGLVTIGYRWRRLGHSHEW